METKDIVALSFSGAALLMSGISLVKSFRQDWKISRLKQPLIDFVLPRFEGHGQFELRYTVRNRGDAPMRLDAIVGEDDGPIRLGDRNPTRVPVRDARRAEGRPDVWRVPIGAIIEEGARHEGTVWVEGRHPKEQLGIYAAVFTFELSARTQDEAHLRFSIRRTAQD